MANKVILEEDFDFTSEEFFNPINRVSRTADFIRIWFGFEGEEDNNYICIVSRNFKEWLKNSDWSTWWDTNEMFNTENRGVLRMALFGYLQKKIFQGDIVQDLEIEKKALKERVRMLEKTLYEISNPQVKRAG